MATEPFSRIGLELHPPLARAYCRFLLGVDWNDRLMVAGAREGIRKFLSNAPLSLFPFKHAATHFVSPAALELLQHGSRRAAGLVWEHVVPKHTYVQKRCETAARENCLDERDVILALGHYWILATVTTLEDARLSRHLRGEPNEPEDLLRRYRDAEIETIPNPFFQQALPEALRRVGLTGEK